MSMFTFRSARYVEGFRRPRRSKLFHFNNGFGLDGTLNMQSESESSGEDGEGK